MTIRDILLRRTNPVTQDAVMKLEIAKSDVRKWGKKSDPANKVTPSLVKRLDHAIMHVMFDDIKRRSC